MSNVPHPVANILIGDDWEDVVTLEQMHAYAAAVSAAKDAEIERLRERVRVLEDALRAMLTHMGMDEDEWNKPTFDQARAALEQKP